MRLPKHREEEAERKLALMEAEAKLPGKNDRPDYTGCRTGAEAAWITQGGDLAEYRRLTDTKAQALARRSLSRQPGMQHLDTHVSAEHEQAMLKAGVDPTYAGCRTSTDYRAVKERHERLDAASPESVMLERFAVARVGYQANIRRLKAEFHAIADGSL